MKPAYLIVFFLVTALTANSQDLSKAELREYFLDAEFFLAQEEYADALFDYQELYNNGYSEVPNINYRIGICYLNLPGQKDKAISYLLKATERTTSNYRDSYFKQVDAHFDAWLYLGNAYRVNNMPDKAIEAYTTFKTFAKSKYDIDYADQEIQSCHNAMNLMKVPVNVIFTNLGDAINTSSSNFRAVLSGDGKTMVYMNELPFYDAVYYTTFREGEWTEPLNITSQIQSDGDQYVSSLSFDGTRLYLAKEDDFNSDIYVSRLLEGSWVRSQPIAARDINTKYWESHASESADGKRLFFTSNRTKGEGNMDIFYSELQPDGVWGEPVNLGSVVNTPLNEDTPFLTADGSKLYFSSQGHNNMGGYDIFVSQLVDGVWATPENLGYPVNTTDNDLFYYPWYDDGTGFVSIIREDGYGGEDIYGIRPYGVKSLADLLFEVTGEFPPVKIAETEPSVEESSPAASDLSQEPEPVIEFLINPVYFEFDSKILSEKFKEEVLKVLEIMNRFSGGSLRLIGHTDSKGAADYNLKLSQQRAESVKDFLIKNGLGQDRVSVIAKGETGFAAINTNSDGTDSPEGRKLNRRVEFEMNGLDSNIIIIATPIPEVLRYKE